MLSFREELENLKGTMPKTHNEYRAETILKEVLSFFSKKDFFDFTKIKKITFSVEERHLYVRNEESTMCTFFVSFSGKPILKIVKEKLEKEYGSENITVYNENSFSLNI